MSVATPWLMNAGRRRMLMYPWGDTDVVSTRGFTGSIATMADAAAWGLEGGPSVPCQQARTNIHWGFTTAVAVVANMRGQDTNEEKEERQYRLENSRNKQQRLRAPRTMRQRKKLIFECISRRQRGTKIKCYFEQTLRALKRDIAALHWKSPLL